MHQEGITRVRNTTKQTKMEKSQQRGKSTRGQHAYDALTENHGDYKLQKKTETSKGKI